MGEEQRGKRHCDRMFNNAFVGCWVGFFVVYGAALIIPYLHNEAVFFYFSMLSCK